MYIFSMENPFFRFVGRVVDLVWINILTLICAIPVITAGASFTAMYRVLIRIAVREEGPITKEFFKEFIRNFKKATPVWISLLIILTILLSNAYLMYQGVLERFGDLYVPVGVSIGLISIFALIFMQYYFAILSRYQTNIKSAIKNAALLMFAYFPKSICMLIIGAFPIALMMLSDYFVWFWFLYGISFPCYFIAMLLGNIFLDLEEKDEKVEKKAEEEPDGQGAT